jgi:hypothetical protein
MGTRVVKSFALAVAVVFTLLGSGVANAGRPRVFPPVAQHPAPNPSPTTPEPTAALIFGLGLGAVSWASRRTRG